MLNEDTPASDRTELARQMRAALGRIKRALDGLPRLVDKVRATMPPPQEPYSLDQVAASRKRARHHAHRAEYELKHAYTESPPPRALVDVHHLIEEIRQGLMSAPILEDLAEMLVEASGNAGLADALRRLEAQVLGIGVQADDLFTQALDAQQDVPSGAKPMMNDNNAAGGATNAESTADALRNMTEMLATVLAGSGTPGQTSAASPGRRYAAVADQMTASFEAYGLPHDGVQLPHLGEAEHVRSQLIDSLQRNFISREEDGTRVYFQTTPQSVTSRDPDRDALLLRGGALVNANLLRAEADSVLAIIDRLPDMLRFTPVQSRLLADTRRRLRGMLDQIVATASDPLGLNAERGKYQFKRLSATVLEVLRNGEVIDWDAAAPGTGTGAADRGCWESLAANGQRTAEHLRTRTTVVRAEEVSAELCELGKLMNDIQQRATQHASATRRGVAAGQLEELLTAADAAAVTLDSDLTRFGTSAMEQGLQTSSEAEVSLAQFIGWVRSVCAPFTGPENAAANLLPEEATILAEELQQLSQYASTVVRNSSPVGYAGVRRQFEELERFLAGARAQALALTPDGASL